jgi:hypothetical protein
MQFRMDLNSDKIGNKSGSERMESKKVDRFIPVGSKALWHLNKKEYTKVNDEKPFAKWVSLNGGVLLIDDERVLRKDVFTVLSEQ